MAKAKKKKTVPKRKRSSQKRDLVTGTRASSYAKRTSSGQFKEMDDTGRAAKGDRRRKAKRRTKSGYGDRGDR
jgi:hypothetical protein